MILEVGYIMNEILANEKWRNKSNLSSLLETNFSILTCFCN